MTSTLKHLAIKGVISGWKEDCAGLHSRMTVPAHTIMDVVVTVPQRFGLDEWINEGDPAGEEWSGEEWHFYLGAKPKIEPGERVYVVYGGILRGYAPLVRIDTDTFEAKCGLVRHGEAVAITIPQYIRGFRGFRYRWWDTSIEVPFPDWQNPHAHIPGVEIAPSISKSAAKLRPPFGEWLAGQSEAYAELHRLVECTPTWPKQSTYKRVHETYISLTSIDEGREKLDQLYLQLNLAWAAWRKVKVLAQ